MSPEEYPVEQCFDTQAILIREDLISELKEKIAELETGLAEAMKVIRQNAGTISALRAENANQAAEIERLLITVREMDLRMECLSRARRVPRCV